MDNTELHYITYDPQEIWDAMITNYVEAGGDILYPGDEKEMLLRSVQSDIVQLLAGVDNALRMSTLRYAVGEYLDLIGESRGCERIEATAAQATVAITTNATGTVTGLAAGTAMTADGEMYYTLNEHVTLPATVQTITATVTADKEGIAGNALLAGMSMDLVSQRREVNNIVVTQSASGGKDGEDDDTYRERIREYGLSSVTTGTAGRYEAVAKEVSTQIIDAKAINTSAGNVGIYLILSSQTGAAALIAEVLEAVSADDVKPLTDTVTVSQATDIPYNLEVDYTCDGTTTTIAAIEAARDEYVEWQNNTIGRTFNPDKLYAMLYSAGAERVYLDATYESEFNGSSTIEYTEIDSNERCLGTVTLYNMNG